MLRSVELQWSEWKEIGQFERDYIKSMFEILKYLKEKEKYILKELRSEKKDRYLKE